MQKTEVRVGLFVLVAVVLGLYLATMLKGGLASRTGGYQFEIWFAEAPSVGKGSPLRLAGVDVGEVVDKDVIQVSETGHVRVAEATSDNLLPYELVTQWWSGDPQGDKPEEAASVEVSVRRLAPVELSATRDYQRERNVARLRVRVRGGHDLYTRYRYEIVGGMVLGDRQLNVSDAGPDGLPLSAAERGESIPDLLQDRRRIAVLGKPPPNLDAIISNAQEVADAETAQRLKRIIANIDRATDESGELLAALRATVQANQGNVNVMMGRLSDASGELGSALSEARGKLSAILDHANEASAVASRLAMGNEERGQQIVANVENITGNLAGISEENRESIRVALDELSKTTAEVRALVAETHGDWGQVMGRLADTSRDLQWTTAETSEKLASVMGMVEDATGRMRDVVRDSDESLRLIASNTAALTGGARESLDELRADLPEISGYLRDTTSNAAEATARMRDLAGDPALREALSNTEQMTAEARDLLSDVRRLTSDPQLQQDLRETVTSAKEAAQSVASLTGNTGPLKPQVGLTAYYASRESDWNSDLRLGFGMRPGRVSYHFFVDNLTTKWRLGAQLGRTMISPNLLTRYGFYRGKLAVGADYGLSPSSAARFDFYDPGDPKLNLRYSHQLPFGLSAYVGVDDLLDRPDLILGAQLGAPSGAVPR